MTTSHLSVEQLAGMSELSEAEKRRILRERRQKKFSNGGASSRLNQITGQTEKSFLSTESPLDSRSSTPSTPTPAPTNNEQSTKQMEELLASISPPSSASKGNKPKSEGSSNPQMDLFAQLAKMQQSDANESTPDTPDIFAQLLKSVQQQESAQSSSEPPADAAMIEAHNKKVNKLKAFTVLIKWLFFLTPYIIYITNPAHNVVGSSLLDSMLKRSNFFTVFTSFEVVAISVYYQILLSVEKSHKVNTLQSNSKILQLVSMVPEGLIPIRDLRGKASLALQYWDVLSMYLTDLCFALVLMGVLHRFYYAF